MATKAEAERRRKAASRGGTIQTNMIERYTQPRGSPGAVCLGAEGLQTDTSSMSEVSLQDLMAAITGLKADMGQQFEAVVTKIDTVAVDVTLIRADLAKTNERVKALDLKTSSLVNDMAEAQSEIGNLRASHDLLLKRMEDYDNRARRNNIRLVGVPEGDGSVATDLLVEELIVAHLAPAGLSKFFAVERAYRFPGGQAKLVNPPRPIIAKLFHYRDRDAILQAARKHGPLKYDNNSISIYPDFTPQVQRQRSGFLGVKRRLRDRGLKYAMLFPARLRIEYRERAYFFDQPERAADWLDSLPADDFGSGGPGGAESGAEAQE